MILTHGRRTLFATICAVSVATIYVAQPVLAQVGDDLGVRQADLGWVVTAGQLGYLIGLAFLVPLGDMLDRRDLIGGHLLLAAAGSALAAFATQLWVLLAGLALTGLFAVVVQTTVAYAADLSSRAERGRTLGAVTSGVVVGILGARVLAGGLAALSGWRSVYAVLTALLVVLAGLALTLLPTDPRTARARYGEVLTALTRLFRDRLLISRGLIAFFLFASFGTLWSGLALPLSAEPWRLSPRTSASSESQASPVRSAPPEPADGPTPGEPTSSRVARSCSSWRRGWQRARHHGRSGWSSSA